MRGVRATSLPNESTQKPPVRNVDDQKKLRKPENWVVCTVFMAFTTKNKPFPLIDIASKCIQTSRVERREWKLESGIFTRLGIIARYWCIHNEHLEQSIAHGCFFSVRNSISIQYVVDKRRKGRHSSCFSSQEHFQSNPSFLVSKHSRVNQNNVSCRSIGLNLFTSPFDLAHCLSWQNIA